MNFINKTIIGLVGHPSCGKDTVAEYLVDKYGFTHVSTGDLLRDYIKNNNLGEPTRENLNKVSNNLRREKGPGILAQMALANEASRLVISGCRAVAEAKVPKDAGAKIIFITTPLETRYERALARGRIGENISLEEFRRVEEKEFSNSNINAPNLSAVKAMADYTIMNSGGLEDLYTQVDKIVVQLLHD